MIRIAVAIAVLAVLLTGTASAAKTTFSVEVTPPSSRADAIASALRAELADERLQLARGRADLVLRCEIVGTALRFTIAYADRRAAGVVSLAGDRKQLAGELRDHLHRLVKPPDEDAAVPGPPASLA